MKKILPFLLLILLFLSLIPIGSGDVNVTVDDYFEVGNELYGFNSSMIFSQIVVNNSWIKFNNTGINITSANNINITLLFLHENYSNATNGEKIFEFYVNTTGGIVWFNLSGLVASQGYSIRRGGVVISTPTANAFGNLSFSNNVWSEHLFEILNGSANTAPNATNDVYNVDEAGILTIDNTSGILANDNDTDGDNLTAILVNDVSQGDLTLNSNGSFTYKAPVDYSGIVTFTYYANDGTENSNLATVYLYITQASGTPWDNKMMCYQRIWTKDDQGQIVIVYSGGRIKRITGYDSIIVTGIDDIKKFEGLLFL